MSWSFGGPSLASITQLLQSPECKLEEVLMESTLPQAIRNSIKPLIDFITRDDILTEILDWALTNKNKDHPKCAKLTRSSVQLLTSSSQQIQQKILEQPIFKERLNSFMTSEEAQDPRIGGHYQRIFEQVVRGTSGEILKETSAQLQNFLIHGMSILGLRELFILLSTEFSSNFDLTIETIKELSQQAKTETGYFVATAIKSILKQKTSAITQMFENPDVVRNLLDAAMNASRPLVAAELYQTVGIIVEKSTNKDEINSILSEYAQKFIDANKPVDCSTAHAAKLFNSINTDIFQHIFETPVNTILNQSIIYVVKNMNEEARTRLLGESDAPHKIMQAYNQTKVNGQLSELVPYISKLEELPQDWQTFTEQVEKDDKQCQSEYGGSLPHSADTSSSSASSDDNDMFKKKSVFDDDDEEESDEEEDASYDDDSSSEENDIDGSSDEEETQDEKESPKEAETEAEKEVENEPEKADVKCDVKDDTQVEAGSPPPETETETLTDAPEQPQTEENVEKAEEIVEEKVEEKLEGAPISVAETSPAPSE